jgi:regulator of protease activity HflC (stomatin/prohibitin superfamily)
MRKTSTVQQQIEAETMQADNKCRILKIQAQAEAESMRVKGQAEADVINMKAEAEAASIRAIGEAEAAVLQQKGAHPNAALSLLVEGQVKAFQGIEKVVYCNTDSQVLLQQISGALSQVGNFKKG